MKQTVEEAADKYADEHYFHDRFEDALAKTAFTAGADWKSKQSPWISVKDRLPEENELVLCRMVSNGAIVSGYISHTSSGKPRVATLPDFEFEDYCDYECDLWMPIPSFDEILEANRDVLQRLKEKGD